MKKHMPQDMPAPEIDVHKDRPVWFWMDDIGKELFYIPGMGVYRGRRNKGKHKSALGFEIKQGGRDQ